MTVNTSLSAWAVRILLAALFLLGGEVLLWTNIQQYTVFDWLLRVVGYLALSILTFDIAARYRIRDVYDAMILLAVVGLLAGLLISPEFSFANFPRSLLTRVLGGYTLLFFEMFGLFIVLTRGDHPRYQRLLVGTSAWLGFYWGIWMRWNPEFGGLFPIVNLQVMFLVAGGFLAVCMLLWLIASRLSRDLTPSELLLSPAEWVALLVIFILLFLWQAFQENVGLGAMFAVLALLVVCWSVLWFRQEDDVHTLLDDHLPMKPLSPLWIIVAVVVFVISTLIAFNLPLVGTAEINQLWLMEIGFVIVGALWLPLVATVIAMRGLDWLMRTNQLS